VLLTAREGDEEKARLGIGTRLATSSFDDVCLSRNDVFTDILYFDCGFIYFKINIVKMYIIKNIYDGTNRFRCRLLEYSSNLFV